MTPLAVTILSLVAQYGPVLTQKLIQVANKDDVKLSDWDALFNEIKAMDYNAGINAAQARLDAKQ